MSEAPGGADGHSSDGRFRLQRTLRVTLEQSVRAPRDRLWRACAHVDGLQAWQADAVHGAIGLGASVTLSWPSLGVSVPLDVVELEEPSRIVFRNGDARVELGIGEESVRLVHSGLAATDDLGGLEASWRVALALLAHSCERHPERRRSVRWWLGPTRCSAEAAYQFFTDEGALQRWLTRRGSVAQSGAPLALELGSGAPLSGRVLANAPGRDVALSWAEDGDSALVLRTLPAADAGERIVALCWSRWTTDPPTAERAEELGAAHGRLLAALDRRGWV
jgi:uncharacterized protein YndB with AHSA1/START domain